MLMPRADQDLDALTDNFVKDSMISCKAKLAGQNPVHQAIDALERSKHGLTGKTGRMGNQAKMSHEAIKGAEGSSMSPYPLTSTACV